MNHSFRRSALAIAFLGVLAGIVTGAPLQAVSLLPRGYWNLDDSASPAVDAIAGANGTWFGNPTRVTTALPAFSYGNKSALQFSLSSGVDQYVEIPNSTVLDSIQNNTYSISTWCKPTSVPAGTGSANNAGYGFVLKDGYSEGIMYDANQKFEFQHWLTGNVWSGTGGWGATTPPGAWYHVVAVWDNAAGSVQMWINGVQQGSSSIPANTSNRNFGTSKWRIGIQYPGATNYRWNCDGMVDDVRLYDYALNGNQINVLYMGCPTPTALAATAAGTQINLTWTAPTGPAVPYTYNVKRGTATGSETTIAPGVLGTTYTDTTAVPGTTYYYVVTAVNAAESGPSNEVTCRTAPISVTPTSLSVVEAGGTATFQINLLAPLSNGASLTTTATVTYTSPGAPVLLSNGGGLVTSLPISFTGNGSSLLSQTITVTGVDDFIAANPLTATVVFSTVASTDPAFNNATLPSVLCNQIESDFAGVLITPTSLSITNGGPPVTFTVQLSSKPTTNVTMTLGVSMPALATVAGPGASTTLTFTPGNWNVAQTVTLTPLDANTATTYIASFDVAFTPVTGDASYQGLAIPSVPVFEPTSLPPLKKVWHCGLLGLEGFAPLLILALARRRSRQR